MSMKRLTVPKGVSETVRQDSDRAAIAQQGHPPRRTVPSQAGIIRRRSIPRRAVVLVDALVIKRFRLAQRARRAVPLRTTRGVVRDFRHAVPVRAACEVVRDLRHAVLVRAAREVVDDLQSWTGALACRALTGRLRSGMAVPRLLWRGCKKLRSENGARGRWGDIRQLREGL